MKLYEIKKFLYRKRNNKQATEWGKKVQLYLKQGVNSTTYKRLQKLKNQRNKAANQPTSSDMNSFQKNGK